MSFRVWDKLDGNAPPLPAETSFYLHHFARFPRPDGSDPIVDVRLRLFGKQGLENDLNRLLSISAGALAQPKILPTSDQAATLFDALIQWRPSLSDGGDGRLVLLEHDEADCGDAIGQAVTTSIAGQLESSVRTEVRAQALLSLIDEGCVVTAIGALPYFVGTAAESETTNFALSQRISRGLQGASYKEVMSAARAIDTWTDLPFRTGSPVPSQLIERIVSTVESGRHPWRHAILWCTNRLVGKAIFSESDRGRLAAALGQLWTDTSYGTVDPDDEAAVSLSLVRSECVILADALQTSGISSPAVRQWLEAAATDPLPEIRFALARSNN